MIQNKSLDDDVVSVFTVYKIIVSNIFQSDHIYYNMKSWILQYVFSKNLNLRFGTFHHSKKKGEVQGLEDRFLISSFEKNSLHIPIKSQDIFMCSYSPKIICLYGCLSILASCNIRGRVNFVVKSRGFWYAGVLGLTAEYILRQNAANSDVSHETPQILICSVFQLLKFCAEASRILVFCVKLQNKFCVKTPRI